MTPPPHPDAISGGSMHRCRVPQPVMRGSVIKMLTFPAQRRTDDVEGAERWAPKREETAVRKPSWKLLLWTAFGGLIFGLIGFGLVADDFLCTTRNLLHWHKASGQIVLVRIDDTSLRDVGRWPWPRRYHAKLVDQLTNAGAKRIFIDIGFFGATDEADDSAFENALKKVEPGRTGRQDARRSRLWPGKRRRAPPLPRFRTHGAAGNN